MSKAMEQKAFGSAEYEQIIKSTIVSRPYDPNSNREEIQRIHEWTDEKLKELYREEKMSGGSKMHRFEQQIKILDESMRKMCGLARIQCLDQANFLWKLWQSAGDLYSSVLETMAKTIDDLNLRLTEKTIASANWEEKYHVIYRKYNRAIDSRNATKDTEYQSSLRKLEEELLVKDKELLRFQDTLINIALWFPNFQNFGSSILTRFLPPVSAQVIESNRLALSAVPSTNIDQQVKLAKDYLLDDLHRIEELNLGFEIVVPSADQQPDRPHKPTPKAESTQHPSQSSFENTKKKFQSRKFSNVYTNAPREDLHSLNKGLFLNPPQSVSFSIAAENEYNLKPGQRTDSSDYQDTVNLIAEQLAKRQNPLREGGDEDAADEEDPMTLVPRREIEELKQKLQMVLQEAQVLESQNSALQSSSRRQILGLENEVKLANKREKLLLAQLKRVQSESSSITDCLPRHCFLPKTSSQLVSLDISAEDLRSCGGQSAAVLEESLAEFLDQFLSSHWGSSAIPSSSADQFSFEGGDWSLAKLTNLISGQSKQLMTLPPLRLSVQTDEAAGPVVCESVFLAVYFQFLLGSSFDMDKALDKVRRFLSSLVAHFQQTADPAASPLLQWVGKAVFGPEFEGFESLLAPAPREKSRPLLSGDYAGRQCLDFFLRVLFSTKVSPPSPAHAPSDRFAAMRGHAILPVPAVRPEESAAATLRPRGPIRLGLWTARAAVARVPADPGPPAPPRSP
jgi:hypothetical protein